MDIMRATVTGVAVLLPNIERSELKGRRTANEESRRDCCAVKSAD